MNTYFEDIEYHLLSNLNNAKERILIAVAWFTNERISHKLVEKKDLDLDIILDDNRINRMSKAISILKQHNINVSFIRSLASDNNLMHNKFCVIDNITVLTGSYNWTHNANKNEENLSKISDKKIAIQYNLEFSRIKNLHSSGDEIFFPKIEEENIVNSIKNEILEIIDDKNSVLKPDTIFNWTNSKIENRIRTVSERLNNFLSRKTGNFEMNVDLYHEYGSNYHSLASQEDKAKLRLIYKEKGGEKTELYTIQSFHAYKIRAINQILDSYINRLKNDSEKSENEILRITSFLIKEKLKLAKELNKIGA